MTEQEIALIEKLTSALGQSGGSAITLYARWFIASSLAYIVAGLAAITLAVKWKPQHTEEELKFACHVVRAGTVCIGVLFIIMSISDLVAPEAAAIHQLIMDIRG